MPKMIELIRDSAVPANIMRTASRGALALPAPEMVEILVYLVRHPVFGAQAKITLAGWDEKSASAIAGDAETPREVLEYWLTPENVRLSLLPALLENNSVDEAALVRMAARASREVVATMLRSPRVRSLPDVLNVLKRNSNLQGKTEQELHAILGELASDLPWAHEDDVLALDALAKFEVEHKDEIAAEEKKPFQLFVTEGEEADELAKLAAQAQAAKPAVAAKPEERERVSTFQKIARLTVGERVQLAMKGTKDERFILVRDGAKVVCLAVLESPKLSDSEVEGFAGMKNVQEIVLRTIAGKRKFIKHYAIIRQLTSNPRTPIDVALPLLSHLLVHDLKNLSLNKNVSDTVRKLAYKLHREKSSTRQA